MKTDVGHKLFKQVTYIEHDVLYSKREYTTLKNPEFQNVLISKEPESRE